jgi:hypothetical protein
MWFAGYMRDKQDQQAQTPSGHGVVHRGRLEPRGKVTQSVTTTKGTAKLPPAKTITKPKTGRG